MTEEQRRLLAERWVLELVILGSRPVDWFGAATSDRLLELANRPLSGLGIADVREAIVRLSVAGAIVFREEGWHDRKQLHSFGEQQVRAAMMGSPYQYSLTKLGGRMWEGHARPDWGWFSSTTGLLQDRKVHEHSSVMRDRERAERFVHWHLLRYGCAAIPGSVIATEESPWWATYWKKLPKGWRITFSYQQVTKEHVPPEAVDFFSCSHNWFESPFRDKRPPL